MTITLTTYTEMYARQFIYIYIYNTFFFKCHVNHLGDTAQESTGVIIVCRNRCVGKVIIGRKEVERASSGESRRQSFKSK